MQNKILMICSLAKGTGAYLRGTYYEKSLKELGNQVDFIKPFRRLPFETYYLFSLPYYLFKSVFKKCDVVICLKTFPNAMIPALLKKNAIKIIDIDDLDSGFSRFSWIMSKLQDPFIKYFDLITVHNDELYKRLTEKLKIPKEKIYRIEQGVRFDIFDKDKYKKKKSDYKTIVYTGHLSRTSDLDYILLIFSELSKKEKMKFIVVGGGIKLEKYKKLARKLDIKNIEFTGYVLPEKTAEFISKADACIVHYPEIEANKYRASMKIREYLAMEKPAVCNSFGDLKKFKKYTYQFNSKNLNEAVQICFKALKSDGREKSGYKYVRENMSWDKIAKGIVKRIDELRKTRV